MKKAESKTIFSAITTIFIIMLIVMLGPANAVTISVATQTQPANFGDITSFIARIDMKASERVPFQNLSATITDESGNIISQCFFDMQGNKLTPCDSSFISIQKIAEPNYDQGERIGEGYGTNNTIPDGNYTTDFGYGYGFPGSNITNQLQYNISWQTPNLQIAQATYKISVEANAQSSTNYFKYKTKTPTDINIELAKPVALLSDSDIQGYITETILINASPSFDPNNLEITNYKITREGETIIESQSPLIDFEIDYTGIRTYNLIVTNQLNVSSTPLTFTIEGLTDFKESNFELDVARFVERGTISFSITQNAKFPDNTVKIKPVIECFGIDINYRNKYHDTILRLRDIPKTFPLTVKRLDYELKVPLENDCTFKTILTNEQTGEQITLSKEINFVDNINKLSTEEQEIDASIGNGNELINYIYKSINTKFSPGYNAINFNFKNERQTDIETEIKIIIPDLGISTNEHLNINSKSDSKVTIPIFIPQNTKPGMYPFRISYRINQGELTTKYGFLKIE
jgi:hypothetical protein